MISDYTELGILIVRSQIDSAIQPIQDLLTNS